MSHSEISGSLPVSGSPELFAAVHVLRRLSSPRHPPCALSSLTLPLRHALNWCPKFERRTRSSTTHSGTAKMLHWSSSIRSLALGLAIGSFDLPGFCRPALTLRHDLPADLLVEDQPKLALDALFNFQRTRAAVTVDCRVARRPLVANRRAVRPENLDRPPRARLRAGGADRVRTDDLRLAKPALSQLSYSPSLLG